MKLTNEIENYTCFVKSGGPTYPTQHDEKCRRQHTLPNTATLLIT